MSRLSQIRGALTRQGTDHPSVVLATAWAIGWIIVFVPLIVVAIGVATGLIP